MHCKFSNLVVPSIAAIAELLDNAVDEVATCWLVIFVEFQLRSMYLLSRTDMVELVPFFIFNVVIDAWLRLAFCLQITNVNESSISFPFAS